MLLENSSPAFPSDVEGYICITMYTHMLIHTYRIVGFFEGENFHEFHIICEIFLVKYSSIIH